MSCSIQPVAFFLQFWQFPNGKMNRYHKILLKKIGSDRPCHFNGAGGHVFHYKLRWSKQLPMVLWPDAYSFRPNFVRIDHAIVVLHQF